MSEIVGTTLRDLATSEAVPFRTISQGSAKAWGNLNGSGTIALRDSFNMGAPTDIGLGQYVFNYTTSMPNTNYAAILHGNRGDSASIYNGVAPQNWSETIRQRIFCRAWNGAATNGGSYDDFEYINFAVLADPPA